MKVLKKLVCLVTALGFLIPCSINASTNTTSIVVENKIEMQDDGSYYVTTITENTKSTRANSKTGTKTTKYINSEGGTEWQIAVTGTFTYTGTSSTCTSASASATAFNSYWTITSKSSSKSGNKATATATAKNTYAGAITKSVTLSCSITGLLA